MNYVFIFLFTFIKWLLFSYNLLLFICDVYMYIPLFKFNSYTPNRFPDKKKEKKTIQLQLISSNKPFFSKEKNYKTDDFQRWISRLVYRWRTLRTAIRNANCTTQWIIEILNAHCAMTAMSWHAWSSVFSKPIQIFYFSFEKQKELGVRVFLFPKQIFTLSP